MENNQEWRLSHLAYIKSSVRKTVNSLLMVHVKRALLSRGKSGTLK